MEVGCQGHKDVRKHAIVGPFLEMHVAGLVGRVALWQVLPPGSIPKYSEDAIKYRAWRRGGSFFTVSTLLDRYEWL